MHAQSHTSEPAVCVWSSHPLAAQSITDAIKVLGYRIMLLPSVKEALPQLPGRLLLLDGCCDDGWPKLAVHWRQYGGTVLLLLHAEASNKGNQLQALFLGVSGVVTTSGNWQDDVRQATKAVLKGRLWVSREVLNEYVKRTSAHDKMRSADRQACLTAREEQIMSLLMRGESNKEIGGAFGISERTVKYHVSNILQKSQVSSRKELRSLAATQAFTDSSRDTGFQIEY